MKWKETKKVPSGIIMMGSKLGSNVRGGVPQFTFRTDVGARDAHFDAVLLHLHLVAGTRSDAGVVVHHEII